MEIAAKIEELRLELYQLGEEKGIQDPEVIKLSQKLDELIVQFILRKIHFDPD